MININNLAPIVLFVYNRPNHTRKTIEALQKNHLAKDSILYIFADGAKTSANDEQIASVQQTRDYIKTVSGFKEVVIEEAQQNKGLANSVIYGVTKVINQYGKVIVVEDDLVTSPHFLRLLNEQLEVYKDDGRIFMVTGCNYNIKMPWYYRKDMYITHRGNSTGWGCWKECWDCADWNITDYHEFMSNPRKQALFNRGGDDLTPMLRMQMEGKIDSWAIRWEYTMYKYDAYCVHPVKTFLWNSGFDGSGIHSGTRSLDGLMAPMYESEDFCIKLPYPLKSDKFIEKRFRDYHNPNKKECLFQKIRKKIALRTRLRKLLGL